MQEGISPSMLRQQWLEAVAVECRALLAAVGCTVPNTVRLSVGWPGKGGYRGKAIGECWYAEASSDAHREVFISPKLTDSVQIMGVVIHELIHAALPSKVAHGPAFKAVALSVGLVGKMTSTEVGEPLKSTFQNWISKHGEYPSGSIDPSTLEGKKQTTRYLKCECMTCGYTARVVKKWLAIGAPLCPSPECDSEPLSIGGDEGGEDAPERPSFNPIPTPVPEAPKPPETPPAPPKAKPTPKPAPEAPKAPERPQAPAKPARSRKPKPAPSIDEAGERGLAAAREALKASAARRKAGRVHASKKA